MTGNNCPLVSVIIPYYNGRRFIREALQSVLNQTYPRIEIIVVDDASPNSEDAACIKQLSDEMGFKLIIHASNEGIAHTMADAAEASQGEYIAELSQDDFYKPQKIEKQMEELTAKKLNAVYAVGDILDQTSGCIRTRDSKKTRQIIQSGRAGDYLKSRNLVSISLQGLLAEREVFEKDIIPIWRDFLLDDWPVNARLFEKYRVGFIEEPLWTGRGHDTNTSRNIWKWVGPQIEVVARLAPDSSKAEAVGNRIGSTARRLLKQKGSTKEIIRLAAASLMLTDSPEQYKKASRVLEKISSKDRKAVLDPKCRILEEAIDSPCEKIPFLENTHKTDWNSLGKEIAEVIKACRETERISEIGRVFSHLASCILRKAKSEDFDNAAKIALGGFLFVEGKEEENDMVRMIRSIPAERSRQLVKNKIKILKSKRGFSIKSFLKFRV